MKPVLLFLCLLASTLSQAQIVIETEIYYKSGAFQLTDVHKEALNKEIAKLSNIPAGYAVSVEGHTDNNGDPKFNKIISEKRARHAAEWLGAKGFKIADQAMVGWASAKPIASNRTWKGKAKNRRVTIRIGINQLDIGALLGVKIKPQIKRINVSDGGKFTTKGGVVINVPPNAFTDANGNPLQGIIDFEVKEFGNKVDFLIGGVPMVYTPEGNDALFNSLGMLDINASQQGKPVKIAESKQVSMKFTYGSQEKDVAFYRFDEADKKWAEVNKQGIDLRALQALRNHPECPGGCSRVDAEGYSEMVRKGQRYSVALKEARLIAHYKEWMFNDSMRNTYLDSVRVLDEQMGIASADKEKLSRRYLFKPSLRKKKKTSLALTATVSNTETRHIRNQRWTYWKRENKMPVDSLVSVNWLDAELLYDEETASFKAALLTESGEADTIILHNSTFRPEKKGKPMKASKRAQWARIYGKYMKARKSYGLEIRAAMKEVWAMGAERERLMDHASEYAKKADFNDWDAMQCFWMFSREFMVNEEEKSLCFKDWVEYFEANRTAMQQHYRDLERHPRILAAKDELKAAKRLAEGQEQMRETVRNTLSVSEFGTYNCDQIQRLKDPVIIAATYKDVNGKEVLPIQIYLMDKTLNGIIAYNGNGGYSPYKFGYNKGTTDMMFAFDAKGNAYKCKGTQFRRIKPDAAGNAHGEFILEEFKVKSKKELEGILADN